MSAVFAAAMREWRRSAAKGLLGTAMVRASLQQRIERVMNVTVGREMDRVERFMSFLATVGSTAPFVGLFGTVWGIMNSFQSIAASKNTSLAVVAPGIAEALFATALGLVAAIPAVIAYNKFSTDFGRYAGRLEAFSTEFSAILSRQLDERP
jgi:biopolymer transport protein TolQ